MVLTYVVAALMSVTSVNGLGGWTSGFNSIDYSKFKYPLDHCNWNDCHNCTLSNCQWKD